MHGISQPLTLCDELCRSVTRISDTFTQDYRQTQRFTLSGSKRRGHSHNGVDANECPARDGNHRANSCNRGESARTPL
jgi:hypothetical protein